MAGSPHRFTIMPDEILAFHFMLFSRSHVWRENFVAPLTSLTRIIMPSLSGYTLLLRAVYLVSRGIWQRQMKTPSPDDWRNRQLRHEFSHVLAERFRDSVCLAFTRTSRENRLPVLKVHVSHPHRNGLVSCASARARARSNSCHSF